MSNKDKKKNKLLRTKQTINHKKNYNQMLKMIAKPLIKIKKKIFKKRNKSRSKINLFLNTMIIKAQKDKILSRRNNVK